METIVNDNNFKTEVLDSNVPVLVDFFATWCGPCKMLAPTVEEIATEYEGKVKVCTCDVDMSNDVCIKYGISAVPTLIYFKSGEEVGRSLGYVPKDNIIALFK